MAARNINATIIGPKPLDDYAVFAEAILCSHGINWQFTSRPQSTPTFYSVYIPSGVRWIIHDVALFRTQAIPELHNESLIILYPYFPDDAVELAEKARDTHCELVFVPSACYFGDPETFQEIAERASWIVINREEAYAYTNSDRIEDAINSLQSACLNLVITDGSRGVFLANESVTTFLATNPVADCMDAGAGDTFAAVFAANLFLHGQAAYNAVDSAQKTVNRFLRRGRVALEHPRTMTSLSDCEEMC